MFDFSLLTENEIVNVIISQNKELETSYKIEILIAIQDRYFTCFKFIIEKYCFLSTNLIKKSLKTFKKYLEYIENSLIYDYNNGVIEGINKNFKNNSL